MMPRFQLALKVRARARVRASGSYLRDVVLEVLLRNRLVQRPVQVIAIMGIGVDQSGAWGR